jgi:signal transduction histidine kinase
MSVAVAALAAVALTMLTTWGHDLLPSMMSDSINWSSARLFVVAVILLSLILTAMALLLRGRPSILDVWLLITLWAWLVELVLVMLTSARFSLFWYAGRLYGLLSGVFVLLMLLSETTKLYARLATSVLARHQERESRILTMNSATASIAHEVNQPLAAVVNNGNAALRFLSLIPPNLDETRAAVKRIVSDGHRAASVIQSIRSLFRNVTSEVRPVDVNQIVSDALALVTAELREHRVTVQADLDDTLPRVVGDRVPLQQVIVNLVTNAMEAMSAANSQSRVLRVTSARHDADHVRISMEDTGPGIDPQHIERIFEPFFTTKPTGMGMGLALCRSIVESYQGQLSVTTRHQSGAVFIIVLPVSTGAVG